jgi:hypothetical protein
MSYNDEKNDAVNGNISCNKPVRRAWRCSTGNEKGSNTDNQSQATAEKTLQTMAI